MLYVIATPIGNLDDLTYRAVSTLQSVDYILAEDTRRSKILLTHFKIEKQLVSFHEHNEYKRIDLVIKDLQEGKNIALISDAGTPLISDPGFLLIQRIVAEGLPITTLPGPCAAIAALVLSGCATSPFQFLGFLPKKEGGRHRLLTAALEYPGTTIFYESPFRLIKTLNTLVKINPQAKVVIVREITKKFEQSLRGSAESLYERINKQPVKGEIVLIIEPFAKGSIEKQMVE